MFDYFYGAQAEQFAFYRVPKVLFTNDRFKYLSAKAKTLYGILLDRIPLSAKNGWMLHKMRYDRRYRAVLNKDYRENVSNAAPLHDIGKIATPDDILQKPGRLTDEEFEVMKQYAAAGGEIILHSLQDFSNAEFRQIVYEVTRYHHEKYNGKGYPEGLKGEEIPLHARIMAIADVFDAVSQKRCYRDALPVEECFSIIERGSSTDFDPDISRIFLSAREEVIRLMQAHNRT